MRRHVERAELGEVLSAEAEREDVGVKRFLIGAEDVVRRQVVGNLGVAQVSLDVEVTEGLNTVEAHAIEVGIVVNLGARTDGIAVRLTDVEGNAQRTAAGSGVVKAQNGTVDVGFIAGTVAVEALGFVGRAEDVHPGGEAFRALRGGAAADGSRDLIIDVERRRERAAQSCHVRGSVFSADELRHKRGISLIDKREILCELAFRHKARTGAIFIEGVVVILKDIFRRLSIDQAGGERLLIERLLIGIVNVFHAKDELVGKRILAELNVLQGRLHRADRVERAVFSERHFIDVKGDRRTVRGLIEVIRCAEVDIISSDLTKVQLVDTGVILCKRGIAEVRQHEFGDAAARSIRKDPHYLVRRRSAVSSKVNHRSARLTDRHGSSACTCGPTN